ncbi:sugar-binding domain-containing protein [Pseudorhodobacter sp.]|uniref:sugar-binding domain-containing protein n=1 Tax=Pseudorhodobacter sp. TaxID=1934400 RepID=UPI002649D6E2|nr:sugar-binding domain-containing protein [Pseudorhodobacter sp.]MDN5787867.1 hypothetical protein [Pseudorhodobacter sp.]
MPIAVNVSALDLEQVSTSSGLLNRQMEDRQAATLGKKLYLKYGKLSDPVSSLSGGQSAEGGVGQDVEREGECRPCWHRLHSINRVKLLRPDPLPEADRKMLVGMGVVAELLAHLVRDDGAIVDYPLNDRLVALRPADLADCGSVIGVASGVKKTRPIRATLNGGYLTALMMDEETALNVLNNKERTDNVA